MRIRAVGLLIVLAGAAHAQSPESDLVPGAVVGPEPAGGYIVPDAPPE